MKETSLAPYSSESSRARSVRVFEAKRDLMCDLMCDRMARLFFLRLFFLLLLLPGRRASAADASKRFPGSGFEGLMQPPELPRAESASAAAQIQFGPAEQLLRGGGNGAGGASASFSAFNSGLGGGFNSAGFNALGAFQPEDLDNPSAEAELNGPAAVPDDASLALRFASVGGSSPSRRRRRNKAATKARNRQKNVQKSELDPHMDCEWSEEGGKRTRVAPATREAAEKLKGDYFDAAPVLCLETKCSGREDGECLFDASHAPETTPVRVKQFCVQVDMPIVGTPLQLRFGINSEWRTGADCFADADDSGAAGEGGTGADKACYMAVKGEVGIGVGYAFPGVHGSIYVTGSIEIETMYGKKCPPFIVGNPLPTEKCGHWRLIKAWVTNYFATSGMLTSKEFTAAMFSSSTKNQAELKAETASMEDHSALMEIINAATPEEGEAELPFPPKKHPFFKMGSVWNTQFHEYWVKDILQGLLKWKNEPVLAQRMWTNRDTYNNHQQGQGRGQALPPKEFLTIDAALHHLGRRAVRHIVSNGKNAGQFAGALLRDPHRNPVAIQKFGDLRITSERRRGHGSHPAVLKVIVGFAVVVVIGATFSVARCSTNGSHLAARRKQAEGFFRVDHFSGAGQHESPILDEIFQGRENVEWRSVDIVDDDPSSRKDLRVLRLAR